MEVKLSKVFGAALEGDLSVGERSALAAVVSVSAGEGGGSARISGGCQENSDASRKIEQIWRDLQQHAGAGGL